MAQQLTLVLTSEQRCELERARNHHEKPYVRERATAILKVAAGWSGRRVALNGLLKPRCPDTVYAWIHRYQAEGLEGLKIKPGRGRKPAFSPSAPGSRKCS
jgi:transposase